MQKVTVTMSKVKQIPGRVKYPCISRVGRQQGVTRQHLYYVLERERKSDRLWNAYHNDPEVVLLKKSNRGTRS